MNENLVVCENCGQKIPLTQSVEFEGYTLCQPCFEERTMACSRCGVRVWADENAGDAYIPLCESCYEHSYTTCSRCGRIIHEDDAYYEDDDDPLCETCYTWRRSNTAIHDYYYKPDPIFYGEGTRFFGVELEIDEAGESSSHARKLLEIANDGQERIYCKHDGSLEDGIEIVTHPLSLAVHTKEMPWEAVLQKACELGYTSHQACTCGLHIHVNRTAFGATEQEQDACIARVLYFFEKHWEELLKFSRRTQRQLERWSARYGYQEVPSQILEHAKKGCHGGRYTAVNLTNRNTIEFRMFRGTLKLNTLIATLQLIDRICDVALFMTDEDLKAMPWTAFAADCTQPELVQYLKERQLYVNDPVETTEEV